LIALAIVAIIAMAALSIDIGTLYQASAEAQRAADVAALAGARVISMSGLTGDPNTTSTWGQTCGLNGPSTLAAIAAAQQNTVGGMALATASITVTYSAGSAAASTGVADCTGAGTGFAVNPVVTVQVRQTSVPTFFAHVFGLVNQRWNLVTVSGTASAEAFNPSNAGSYAVQPRCVKPFMIPNYDPLNKPNCNTGSIGQCNSFVGSLSDGIITNPGLVANGGVIGERFWLVPDCSVGAATNCAVVNALPQPNVTAPVSPNLQYVPGQTPPSSTALPYAKSGACNNISSTYAQAIAGCDQSTAYQCGILQGNNADLTENPTAGDTANGVQCLTHQATTETTDVLTPSGQDTLDPFATLPLAAPTYPFVIQAGTDNPLTGTGLSSGNTITSSTSIVSLPIFNPGSTMTTNSVVPVTVVGFLQVFINFVDTSGNVYVTVMNVTGCGQNPGTVYYGTSPVPVRLITPPS
jgi:hypothetical protein